MKKFSRFLAGMMCAAGLLALSSGADAQLNYKQIGTPSGGSTSSTSLMPVYTMSKYGEGISVYKQAAIDLPANTLIKEIAFLGFQKEAKDLTNATIEVYVGNAPAGSSYKNFIIDGEKEGSASTTVFDTSKATLFYSGPFTVEVGGSLSAPVEIYKFSNDTGFTYTGEDVVIFISIATPKTSVYTTFVTAVASGNLYSANGGYRDSGYSGITYPGYGINTKSWYEYGSKQMPVMKLGYEGQRQKISAEISGKIYSSLNRNTLSGATVLLKENSETIGTVEATPSNGSFSFSVDDVDDTAVYSLVASKEGFETGTMNIDIKAGGSFPNQDITLTKLPVPAVLSGKVIDKATSQPIDGAMVTYNSDVFTTSSDGAYSFNIANVDVLPADGLELKASASGYNSFSTNISVTGDMTFNIEMVALPPLPGEGAQIGDYNPASYDYVAPFNSLWNYSVSETIYPKGALENLTKDTKYSSISFFGYLNPTSTGGGNNDDNDEEEDYNDYWTAPSKADENQNPWKGNVKLYMVNTNATRFSSKNDYTDLSKLTPLFEGEVVVNEGGKNNDPALLFTVDFDEAFEYAGESVKLICVADSKLSRLVYFAFDPTYTSNVIGKAGSNLEALNNSDYQVYTVGTPVVRLGDYVPTATVYGTVTDKKSDAPVEGATVTLAKGTEKVSATTAEDGTYKLSWRGISFDETYTVNVEKEPYNEITSDLSFSENTLNMQFNAQLTVNGFVSGVVKDKVTGDVLADMTVKVYTADDTEVTIDETEAKTADDGTYSVSIPDIDYAAYYVEISGGKYNAEKQEVNFTAEKVEVEDVDFEMAFDAVVSGKVTFNDGVAVEGAIVKLGDAVATTDAEGAYSIEVAPVETASEAVTVTYNDEEVYTGTVDMTTGAQIQFDIQLSISGVELVFGQNEKADVYGVNGIIIARDANTDVVKNLPSGIYIINGKKVMINK